MRSYSLGRRWLLAALVAWAAAGFLSELNNAVTGVDRRGTDREIPGLWRLGVRPVARLDACLKEVRRRLPPDSVVAFRSPDGPGQAAFYRWRWAAYLCPRHQIVLDGDPAGDRLARYLLEYQIPSRAERQEGAASSRGARLPLALRPGCRLSRLSRP
jgi:hypothetical protein